MVESTRQVQSRDPYDRFDEAINDPRSYEPQSAARPSASDSRPMSAPTELQLTIRRHEPVPLFLSDYDDDRRTQAPVWQRRRAERQPRIALVAHSQGRYRLRSCGRHRAAIMSMDNPLAVFSNAKASLAGDTSGQLSATRSRSFAAATARSRSRRTPNQRRTALRHAGFSRATLGRAASVSPSRDEITAAYQGAIKSKVVAIEPATQAAAAAAAPLPAARRRQPTHRSG